VSFRYIGYIARISKAERDQALSRVRAGAALCLQERVRMRVASFSNFLLYDAQCITWKKANMAIQDHGYPAPADEKFGRAGSPRRLVNNRLISIAEYQAEVYIIGILANIPIREYAHEPEGSDGKSLKADESLKTLQDESATLLERMSASADGATCGVNI